MVPTLKSAKLHRVSVAGICALILCLASKHATWLGEPLVQHIGGFCNVDHAARCIRTRPLIRGVVTRASQNSGIHPPPIPFMDAAEMRREVYAAHNLWNTSMHAIIKCGGDGGEARYRLVYMPMRNRCEIPRLIMEEAGCPYELEVVGFQAWGSVKSSMPLGKVPVLRNFDGAGNDLAQETSITRFLAQQLGLAGSSEFERASVDMLYQFFFDTLRNGGLTHDGEHYSATSLRDVHGRVGPTYQEMRRVNNFTRAERSLAALGVFEDRLGKSDTGFLFGKSPTYVDLGLFNILFELAEEDHVPDFAERFGFPNLGQFLNKMEQRPNLQQYMQSNSRMPRYVRPGYIYCPGKYSPAPTSSI